MNAGAWITLLAVAALLVAVWRESKSGEWLLKPLASTGFVLSAWQHGALDSGYGRAVLAALCLSWWGDVLLISRKELTFLFGLGAFLLGHLGFAAAFLVRGVAWEPAALAGAIALVPLVVVARWLLPKVSAEMKVPVVAYMLVITGMVSLAVGAAVAHHAPLIAVGALSFYLSDLSVARDRFVAPGFDNKLWGWPLYYGAQLVLAATVAGV